MLMTTDYELGQHVGFVDLLKTRGPVDVKRPEKWYILHVFPHREFKVMKAFKQRNISAWLPTIPSMQEITRYRRGYEWIERKMVTFPLVSGAVIVPDFELDYGRWRDVEGVIGIYRMGPCTPYLNAKLLEQLRHIEAIGNTPRSKRQHLFEVGDLVRVLNGPFRHFSGRVERFDSKHRLTVGVEIFGRITPLDLEASDIAAV